MRNEIFEQIKEHQDLTKKLIENEETMQKIIRISEKIIEAYKNDNKILLCGNGGSAADCQHIAGELVGRFKKERKALSCIAMSTDTSVMTAIGNDYDYSTIFSRQVEALGKSGDILIALSTSGNSPNIIKAVKV